MDIFSLFSYDFMRRAFIIGTLLALVLPQIGQTIVLKRLSMMGDTLAHSSLAGVAIGLSLGFDPIIGSVVFCIVGSLSIEAIRNKLKSYEEISTIIILAASIGIAGIFTSFLKNTNSIGSYLFGSIITISNIEFYMGIAIAVMSFIVYLIIYDRLYLSVFDVKNAELLGMNTRLVSFIFTILTGFVIAISAKTIGSLIVSSLLVIPVIISMNFCKTYRGTLIVSMIFSVIFVNLGLLISYIYDLKPGSVIVLLAVFTLIVALAISKKKI